MLKCIKIWNNFDCCEFILRIRLTIFVNAFKINEQDPWKFYGTKKSISVNVFNYKFHCCLCNK